MRIGETSLSRGSLPRADGRQEARSLPSFRSLLESERQADESRLAPGTSKKRNSDGQAGNESGSDVDIGIARDGGGIRASAGKVVAGDQVGEPCGAAGGCDNRVQVELIHGGVDALGAGKLVVLLDCFQIGLLGKRAFGFGFHE